MVGTEAMRCAVKRYYDRNTDQIIAHKTMRLARERGRVPRVHTIESHNMDWDALKTILTEYALENPQSRAARKISRFVNA